MKDKEINRERSFQVKLRLTKKESERVNLEANKLNKSRPQLFYDAFFRRLPTKVLMTEDNFYKFISEFNRLGNNVNQIARKINSGEAVLSKSFDEFRDDMKMLIRYISGFNGLR